jgi:biopolymer transport protein ExbD
MKFVRPRARRGEEINMAPLIDMVFILLIFFAVSTTFAKDLKIDIQRPAAASSNLKPPAAKSVRVYVDRGGQVYVDDQPVKSWLVESRVKELLRAGASDKVLVITDGAVTSAKLIEVVDQCRSGGAAEVAVAAEAKAG